MDPEIKAGIIAHMNADHADAVVLYAQAFGNCKDAVAATMTDLDYAQMTLEVTTPAAVLTTVIALPERLETPGDARKVLIKMARESRARISSDPDSSSLKSSSTK